MQTEISSKKPPSLEGLLTGSIQGIRQTWLNVRYRRGQLESHSRLCYQVRQETTFQRFGCALRRTIRSFLRHILASPYAIQGAVIVGKGVLRSAKGFPIPDERTTYRNDCIRALRLRYPSASRAQLSFYLGVRCGRTIRSPQWGQTRHGIIEIPHLRYHNAMKTKPTSDEYKAFENMLGKVLTVSKTELNRRIAEDKQEKRIPKSASRVPAVPAKPS